MNLKNTFYLPIRKDSYTESDRNDEPRPIVITVDQRRARWGHGHDPIDDPQCVRRIARGVGFLSRCRLWFAFFGPITVLSRRALKEISNLH